MMVFSVRRRTGGEEGVTNAARGIEVKKPLRTQLLLLIVPVILASYGVAWFVSLQTARGGMEQLTSQNLVRSSKNLASGLSREILNTYGDALTIAELYLPLEVLDSGDPKNFTWYADELMKTNQHYASLLIADAKGEIVATNSLRFGGRDDLPDLKGSMVASERWFKEAMGADRGKASGIGVSRPEFLVSHLETGEFVLGYAMPLLDIADDNVGVLILLLSLSELGVMLNDYTEFDSTSGELRSTALVVDSAGNLVCSAPKQADPSGWSAVEGMLQKSESPSYRWSGPGGIFYQVAHRPVTDPLGQLGLNALVLKSEAEISRPIEVIGGQLMGLFLVTLVLTVIALILVSGRFLAPILALTGQTRKITRAQDFKALPIVRDDEIGALTGSFNAMVSTIQNHEEHLELNVQARTSELKERSNELEATLRELERAQETLIQSEKMASLGQLVAGVAHEINSPLGVGVTASSSLLEHTAQLETKFSNKSLGKKDLRNYLDTAQELQGMLEQNLRRAAELVENFKLVAADQTSAPARKLNVAKYLASIMSSLHPKLRRTALSFFLDCPPDVELNTFPGELAQVVTNLVMNSIAHGFDSLESGQIKIVAIESTDTVRIVYSDDGKGIPAEHIEKIFDPFFTTRRGSGGTGLGLNIVYNVVTQKLGGTVRCRSKPGFGTRFDITLPKQVMTPQDP